MSIQKRIQSLIRPEILELKAYGVADPGDLIKLDAMENPYPWPAEIKKQWLTMLESVDVNRYPDPAARQLMGPLHAAMGIPREQAILLGNGSDEIIQMILFAMARPGAKVLVPAPTFVMYDMIARFADMECISVPLHADDFSLDMQAMQTAIELHEPAVIFLAYPNNPTGNLFARADIEKLLKISKGLVVIDEAYHAFANRTMMGALDEYDNLMVMRTVSKLGLAGLRLGLLAGNNAWCQEFDKVRLPYNINSLTQASVMFILKEGEFLAQQTEEIKNQREILFARMSELEKLSVWPSQANFLLFRAVDESAESVQDELKQAGILIKSMSKAHPLLKDCLRVTVGTPTENTAFIEALTRIISV
jgi:histidinol-phosphate aminotransferase